MRIFHRMGMNHVVLVLSVARLGDAIGMGILLIVIPLSVECVSASGLPFSESVCAGILVSVFGLVSAVLQPFAGILIDRFNRSKPFIQTGLILMGLSTLGFVFVDRFRDMLFLRLLQGIGFGMTIPASLVFLTTATRKQTRGGSIGVYTTLRMVGLSIGPFIGGFLYDHFSYNSTFYAASAFIALAVVLVQLWIKEEQNLVLLGEKQFLIIINRQTMRAGIIGSGLAFFAMACAYSAMIPLEKEFNIRLNQTAFDFSVAFSMQLVSRLIFQVPLGKLSDYLGRRSLIIGGLILMALATILLGEAKTTLQLIWLRTIQGVGSAGIAAPAFALVADLSRDDNIGRLMSFTIMGFGLGITLGPLIAGLLATISFKLPFCLIGFMLSVCAWIIYWYVPETVHRKA